MQRLRNLLAPLLLAALAGACSKAGPAIEEIQQTDLLTAGEIMNRLVENYASCRTYRDTGSVTRTFYTSQGQQQESQQFTTAFKRPLHFRFEVRENAHRYIVHAEKGRVRAWRGRKHGLETAASLNAAIGAAVGPSNGASHTIPRLLMPDSVVGRSLAELTELERLPDALLGETPCYRLAGNDRNGDPYVVWIARETLLVHRIDEGHEFEGFTTKDLTVYEPVVNQEVPEEALEMDAPADAGERDGMQVRSVGPPGANEMFASPGALAFMKS